MIKQRRKKIGKQDRQHHAFRKGRVDDSNQHTHNADQDAVSPAARVGHGRRDRVSGHEEGARLELWAWDHLSSEAQVATPEGVACRDPDRAGLRKVLDLGRVRAHRTEQYGDRGHHQGIR